MSELSDYDYVLPKELIAQQPLAQRADARLLVVHRADGRLEHHHIRDLPTLLENGDCLVMNNTRVVPARLVGYRTSTGGRWEGLFLTADDNGNWRVLGKARGKLQPGETITLVDPQAEGQVQLRLLLKEGDGVWIARPETKLDTFTLLDQVGRVPLPPYIRDGEMMTSDAVRYQTVFAETPGAVAAPTAGLHFTHDLLGKLNTTGVRSTFVTLHVGLDTFRPIAVERLADHPMHSEWAELTEPTVETLRATRSAGRRIVAVGTTAVRVLETAAQHATQQADQPANGAFIAPYRGQTNLFIRPPHQFHAVDALLTNFHLPRTTLLVLVHTFAGAELMRHAYETAIREEYRFYSYGDAMLIL